MSHVSDYGFEQIIRTLSCHHATVHYFGQTLNRALEGFESLRSMAIHGDADVSGQIQSHFFWVYHRYLMRDDALGHQPFYASRAGGG